MGIRSCLAIAAIAAFCFPGWSDDPGSDLRSAAGKGELSPVRQLLDSGTPADAADGDGRTALIRAAQAGSVEVVKLLIERGAQVNRIDKEGFSALRFAAVEGRTDAVRVLLEKGADPNLEHPKGIRPLMVAAVHGHQEVVDLLVSKGADVAAVNEEGQDALCLSTTKRIHSMSKKSVFLPKYPQTIRSLIRAGADPNKSPCFIHPEYGDHNPKSIAIIGVYDRREDKKNSEELVRELDKNFAKLLIVKKRPGLRAAEVRKKLLAAGNPEATAGEPPVKIACAHLGVAAVFKAELLGYAKRNYGVGQGNAYALRTVLTDCKSEALLYKTEGAISEYHGFIIAAFSNNMGMVVGEALKDLPWPEARTPEPKATKSEEGNSSGLTGKIKSVKKVTKVVPHW